jgi:hypothetical protein
MKIKSFFSVVLGGFVAILLGGASASVWAGAWTLDPGRWYSEVGTGFYWDESSFNNDGNERDTPFQGGYSEFATKIYVEYGLKPRLNLISSINHKVVEYTDDYSKLTNSGIQDGVLAVKWRFTEQPVVFSGIVGTRFPMGYSTQRDPELGSGEWNPEARLSVGKTFVAMPPSESGVSWSRFYANAELAKDKRSLLSTLEGGFFATSWLMAKGLLSGARDWPSQPDGQEFNKWNLSLNIASDGTGLLTRQGENKSFNLSLGVRTNFRWTECGRRLGMDHIRLHGILTSNNKAVRACEI